MTDCHLLADYYSFCVSSACATKLGILIYFANALTHSYICTHSVRINTSLNNMSILVSLGVKVCKFTVSHLSQPWICKFVHFLFCTDVSSVILKCTMSDRKVVAEEHVSAAVKQRGYRDAMLIGNLLLYSWARDSCLKKCVNPMCECLKVSVSYKAFHCVQCFCSGVAFV